MNCLQSGINSNPTHVSTSSAKFATLGMFILSCQPKDGTPSKKNGPWSRKYGSQSKKHEPLSKMIVMKAGGRVLTVFVHGTTDIWAVKCSLILMLHVVFF